MNGNSEYDLLPYRKRSAKEDPQPGDEIVDVTELRRRVVARDGSRVGYVEGSGLGIVKWSHLLAWQLWCDGIF